MDVVWNVLSDNQPGAPSAAQLCLAALQAEAYDGPVPVVEEVNR